MHAPDAVEACPGGALRSAEQAERRIGQRGTPVARGEDAIMLLGYRIENSSISVGSRGPTVSTVGYLGYRDRADASSVTSDSDVPGDVGL